MEKGTLFYETPPDSRYRRLLSITIIALCAIAGFGIGNILAIILLTTAGIMLGTVPSVHYPIIHKKFRVYGNGIEQSLNPLQSLLTPSKEGKFIPYSSIRAFERGRTGRRCIVYFHGGDQK